MPTFEARVEIIQDSPADRPDYRRVHEAMRTIGFYQQFLGLHTLPGMYRNFVFQPAENVQASIERALRPLGFRFRIQLIEVAQELTFNLAPALSFAEMLGSASNSLYGSSRLSVATALNQAGSQPLNGIYTSLFSSLTDTKK